VISLAAGVVCDGATLNSAIIKVDDGQGGRQGFLSIEDNGSGIDIDFFDSQGNHPVNNPNGGFVLTTIAEGLSYTENHQIVIDITFVDGNTIDVDGNVFGNDICNIYVDGELAHSGTTWESYWWTTTEGTTPPSLRAIDTLLFRISTPGGAAAAGAGYYIDNVFVQPQFKANFDQDVYPDVIFGSGTVNGEFTMGYDTTTNIELGLRGKVRFNENNLPENTFNTNGDGTYTFVTGSPTGGAGWVSATTPRWAFEMHVNTDRYGSTGDKLSDLTYELGMDVDPGAGTNYLAWDFITPGESIPYTPPVPVDSYDHSMGDNTTANGGGVEVYSDPVAYAANLAQYNVLQQAWNWEFFNEAPFDTFDPNLPGKYDFYLAAFKNGEEVARTAIERRLEDADDRVRLRALQLVAARRDPADHERLERLALAGAPDFALEAMLAIAEARSGDEQFLLELYAHTQSQEEIARRAAAAALSRIPTRDALSLLHRLLRDAELEVRLEALEGLERLRQPASIPRLIDSLGGPRELFTHRAVRVLRMITGEDHGVSRERWQAWFEREGSAFQPPTLAEARRREAERLARRDPGSGGTSASFYGLPVEGTRVTFVLDVSGSMDELASGRGTTAGRRSTRLEVARTEVAASLDQLLDGVRFNLITFASDVRALAPELLELGPRSRAKARDAVGSWRAGGGTALFDGLRRALAEPDVEEVFLLTDGVPTEGEAVEEDDILARVQELVGGRGVKIHGVAIGQRSGLLRRLAQATGGHYTEIR
jgi:hypothetical protein